MREILFTFVSITMIYNPFSKPAQLISLTGSLNDDERKAISNRAVAIAWVLCALVTFFGSFILDALGVSIGSFRIFGGFMLLVFGIQFGLGYSFSTKKHRSLDVAAVPLGSPLLAGPGAISALMLFTVDYGYVVTLIAMSMGLFVCLVFMHFSRWICDVLSPQTVKIMSNIMGMILVAIAVQFITSGLASIR